MAGDRRVVTVDADSVERALEGVPRFLLPDRSVEMAAMIAQFADASRIQRPWQDFLFAIGLERMGWVGVDVHPGVRSENEAQWACTTFDVHAILDMEMMKGTTWFDLRRRLEQGLNMQYRAASADHSRPDVCFDNHYCEPVETEEKIAFIGGVASKSAQLPDHHLVLGTLNA